jgi:hypothetical protein
MSKYDALWIVKLSSLGVETYLHIYPIANDKLQMSNFQLL